MSHEHDFDPISGWCSGCTVREDGRHLWHGGDVIRRPRPTDEETTE